MEGSFLLSSHLPEARYRVLLSTGNGEGITRLYRIWNFGPLTIRVVVTVDGADELVPPGSSVDIPSRYLKAELLADGTGVASGRYELIAAN